METFKVIDNRLNPSQMGEVLSALEAGKVMMHATETCYGLTADIFQQQALERLYALKEMEAEKPVSIMVSSLVQARRYGDFDPLALKLAARFWPGPLTLIVPRLETLPVFLNQGHASVGIRCPDHDLTMSFLKAMGTPLITTSANISGKPQAYAPHETTLRPDLLLDSGRIRAQLPSTIVKVLGGEVTLLRRGDSVDEVEMFLEEEGIEVVD